MKKKACIDCKYLKREGNGNNRIYHCMHESCFVDGVFDPLTAKEVTARIADYQNKNIIGRCPDYEERTT